MKKTFLIFFLVLIIGFSLYLLSNSWKQTCQLPGVYSSEAPNLINQRSIVNNALELLRIRQDQEALELFLIVKAKDPNNISALWGEAEVLRRNRSFAESEKVLNKILALEPDHIPSIISLSYIRYRFEQLKEAKNLLDKALGIGCKSNSDLALIYMMLGSINSKLSKKGWLFTKIKYGTKIKGHFLKAKDLAPKLPEVHLGLGTFYLLAPSIIGGNTDQAIEELETALEIAPGFATANARLAQAYLKKGETDKYKHYIEKARLLDPTNEVLEEIDNEKP